MMTAFYGLFAGGMWSLERGTNLVDTGTPYYEVYACKDGKYISIAPLEDRFRVDLYSRLGLDPSMISRDGPGHRNEIKALLGGVFAEKTRAEWCALLEGTDACFAPVLSMAEAPAHPHLRARGALIEVDGIVQPAPAPRFSRTPAGRPSPPNPAAQSAGEVLPSWGFGCADIEALRASGIVS
jgi:alpha-methylacyl-CoA racemase